MTELERRIRLLKLAQVGFVFSYGDADESLLEEMGRQGLVAIQNWYEDCFVVITDAGEADLAALLSD